MKKETNEERAVNIATLINGIKQNSLIWWSSDFNATLKDNKCPSYLLMTRFLKDEGYLTTERHRLNVRIIFKDSNAIELPVFEKFMSYFRSYYKNPKPKVRRDEPTPVLEEKSLITKIADLLDSKYNVNDVKALLLENTRLMSEIINNQIKIGDIIHRR